MMPASQIVGLRCGISRLICSTVLGNIPGVLADVAVSGNDLNGDADAVIRVEPTEVVLSTKTKRHAIDSNYWLESLKCFIRSMSIP